MPLILGTNSIKDTGFNVANSLRFDDDSSDYLTRTPSSTTNRRTFTISFWIKTSTAGGTIFSTGDYGAGDGFFNVRLSSSGRLVLDDYDQGGEFYNVRWVTPSTTVFRDPSAWYHMVISIDSTQATLSDRVNFYLNGENIDSLFTDNASGTPSQNSDFHVNYNKVHQIGRDQNNTDYFDGYIAEFVMIDGQALDPTSFGEFDEDTGIWKPIDVSELTFGTNGFYLDFENSGSLGADVSGNGNNFTVNNLTSVDQTTDTCTNNFATLNGVYKLDSITLSNGNLSSANTTGTWYHAPATIGASQGKWYCEIKSDNMASGYTLNGIMDMEVAVSNGVNSLTHTANTSDGYGYYSANGNSYTNATGTSYGASLTTGDILQIAMDLDNNYVYFGKNGTWQNSGDPTSGATGTGGISITSGKTYTFAVANYNSATQSINFGSPPFTISSGNSDGNGYGNFEYAVPSGYYALNTKNLAEYG